MARSVLIVDDDAGFRDLAARILTGWGHVVIGEAGSVARRSHQHELRPDIALVDIGLPDGDGFAHRAAPAMPWRSRVVLISFDADAVNGLPAYGAAPGSLPKDEMSGEALRQLIELA